jgi:hypothetical protein
LPSKPLTWQYTVLWKKKTLLMFSLALAWLFDKLQNKQSLKMTKFAFMWANLLHAVERNPPR